MKSPSVSDRSGNRSGLVRQPVVAHSAAPIVCRLGVMAKRGNAQVKRQQKNPHPYYGQGFINNLIKNTNLSRVTRCIDHAKHTAHDKLTILFFEWFIFLIQIAQLLECKLLNGD